MGNVALWHLDTEVIPADDSEGRLKAALELFFADEATPLMGWVCQDGAARFGVEMFGTDESACMAHVVQAVRQANPVPCEITSRIRRLEYKCLMRNEMDYAAWQAELADPLAMQEDRDSPAMRIAREVLRRPYRVGLSIWGYQATREGEIRRAAEAVWPFSCWNECGIADAADGVLEAEVEEAFVDRLARAIWMANAGPCVVTVWLSPVGEGVVRTVNI